MASVSVALVLVTAGIAQAATVTGVVSEQGRPIAGAAVVVDGGEPIVTDQDGRYSADVEAGDRKVSVTLRGYKAVEQTVKAVGEDTVQADLILDPIVQLAVSTAPTTLKRGEAGAVTVLANNTGTTDYTVETVGLRVFAEGKDRSADFTVEPAAGNPTSIKAGQTASLSFNLKAGASAPTGKVTFRASLLAFDASLGKNLITNGSLETVDEEGVPDAFRFATDNASLGLESEGTIVADNAMTGSRAARINVTVSPEGDVRAYWGPPGANWIDLKAGTTYVLSGYIKTENVQAPQFGAAVYVPVVNDSPYQQPGTPWVTGTRDWRKGIVVFRTGDDADGPRAVPRGQIQQGTGIAWFDNISLTEGTQDGSLTVTSADQSIEITS
jgi:hypothetical protein